MTFTLRVPDSENPHLRNEAAVLSWHASLGAARVAFLRQQIIAERQGCHCEAFAASKVVKTYCQNRYAPLVGGV